MDSFLEILRTQFGGEIDNYMWILLAVFAIAGIGYAIVAIIWDWNLLASMGIDIDMKWGLPGFLLLLLSSFLETISPILGWICIAGSVYFFFKALSRQFTTRNRNNQDFYH